MPLFGDHEPLLDDNGKDAWDSDRRCCSLTACALFALMGASIAVADFNLDHKDERFFPNIQGCIALGFAFAAAFAAAIACGFKFPPRTPSGYTFAFPAPDSDGYISEETIRSVFGHDHEYVKKNWHACVFVVGPAILNLWGKISAVLVLPARNPDDPLDFAEHLLPGVECAFMVILVLALVGSCLLLWGKTGWDAAPYVGLLVHISKLIGSISTLAFLNLGPFFLKKVFTGDAKGIRRVLPLFYGLCSVAFGGLALLIVIRRLAFVDTVMCIDWSQSQWIAVATTLLNISNIPPNPETLDWPAGALQLLTCGKIFTKNAKHFQATVFCQMARVYGGYYAAAALSIMPAEDAIELLNDYQ